MGNPGFVCKLDALFHEIDIRPFLPRELDNTFVTGIDPGGFDRLRSLEK
jgi:hypothetical protein